MVSEEGLQQFIALYERKYGVLLERAEAVRAFSDLIRITKIAIRGNEA